MRQLTYEDSTRKTIKYSKRHEHLCEQAPGAKKYADAIKPVRQKAEETLAAREKAREAVTFATDRINLADSFLDFEVKTLHNRCDEYDKANPGSNIKEMVFPGGLLTPVVAMSVEEEPDGVEKMIKKVESLGTGHPLYALTAPVYPLIQNCRDALKDRVDLVKAEGEAGTAEDIAKMELVRAYNANYFAAANDYGKNFAESLFPKVKRSVKKNNDDETES